MLLVKPGIVSGGGAIFMPLALFASRRGTTAIMSLTASISGNTRKLLTDKHIADVDKQFAQKETELMAV